MEGSELGFGVYIRICTYTYIYICMSCSLNSIKGACIKDSTGEYYRVYYCGY